MKVEVLEKDIDTIFKNRGKDMFFIFLSEVAHPVSYFKTGERSKDKTMKRIISILVDEATIDEIVHYVDDDRYALIRIS